MLPPGVQDTVRFLKMLQRRFRQELQTASACLEFSTASQRDTARERAAALRERTGMRVEAFCLPIMSLCGIELYDGVTVPLSDLLDHACPLLLMRTMRRLRLQRAVPRTMPLPRSDEDESALYRRIVSFDMFIQALEPSETFDCDAWVLDSSDHDITGLPNDGTRFQYASVNPCLEFRDDATSSATLRHALRRWSDIAGCRLACPMDGVLHALQTTWHSAVDKTLREHAPGLIRTISGPCLVIGLRTSSYHRMIGIGGWTACDVLDAI